MKLPDFFGLDIGNHSIKIAELEYKGNNASLEKIGRIETPHGVIGNNDDNSINELANSIKQLRSDLNIKTKKVVTALPESVIFSRVISVPFSGDEGELEETVYWEAKQHIPIDIDDVQLDWIEIQEQGQGDNKMLQILLVAAPKNIVNQYMKLAEAADLELIALETESIATTRSLGYKDSSNSPTLILDFGADGTDMSVMQNNNLVFAQSLGTGSDALTKAIANDYNISEQQAEQYKRAYGLLKDKGEGKIAQSLTPVMEIIINEINKTVNYFKAHMKQGTPQRIYVVGDGAKLLGLSEYMSERLGIQSSVGDPLKNVSIQNSAKRNLEELSSVGFSVAVGLGMKTK